jgi:phosphomannomutase / phosphoglucomutase
MSQIPENHRDRVSLSVGDDLIMILPIEGMEPTAAAERFTSWGRALGRQLPPAAKFVVGGDVRESTPPFLAALIEGLCQAGLDVVDLGLLPTPMIYYAKRRLNAAGCAIVTASHNLATINGLKWMLGDRPPTPDDIAALERASVPLLRRSSAERNPLPGNACEQEVPHGGNKCTSAVGKGRGDGDGHDRRRSQPRELDITFDYVACLQETFVESLTVQQHIVLDPMFGCWAGKARRYLQAIFPQCIFATIHDELDGRFEGRTPDCSRASELTDLCQAVYRERAHLGIAFDGDGDRVALVDSDGVALTAEEATWLLLQSLADELRGQRFVYDLKFSDRIPEAARQLGAEPRVERSGHAFLRTRMRDDAAVFGAEVSGHYFYKALEGCDDGLYTACVVIAYLVRSGKTLAELRRECPAVYITPDLRIAMPASDRETVLEQIRAAWAGFPQRNTDGIRIDTPCGWALVRSSVTEPALTFRFEGLDWHALDDLVKRFCDTVPEYGDELWAHFRAAIGGEEQ